MKGKFILAIEEFVKVVFNRLVAISKFCLIGIISEETNEWNDAWHISSWSFKATRVSDLPKDWVYQKGSFKESHDCDSQGLSSLRTPQPIRTNFYLFKSTSNPSFLPRMSVDLSAVIAIRRFKSKELWRSMREFIRYVSPFQTGGFADIHKISKRSKQINHQINFLLSGRKASALRDLPKAIKN